MSVDHDAEQLAAPAEGHVEAADDLRSADDEIEAFDLDDIEVIESKVFG